MPKAKQIINPEVRKEILSKVAHWQLMAGWGERQTIKKPTELDRVVEKTLMDKDLFFLLASSLEKDRGLRLGRFSYNAGSVGITTTYGLTIHPMISHATSLYLFDQYHDVLGPAHMSPRFSVVFPTVKSCTDVKGYPSAEMFVSNLNSILKQFLSDDKEKAKQVIEDLTPESFLPEWYKWSR